jgi:hypothetical protein
VLKDGVVVSLIFLMPIGPRERPWMWASGHNRAIERAVQVTSRHARLRWRRSPRAGDGNSPAAPLVWPLARSKYSGTEVCH